MFSKTTLNAATIPEIRQKSLASTCHTRMNEIPTSTCRGLQLDVTTEWAGQRFRDTSKMSSTILESPTSNASRCLRRFARAVRVHVIIQDLLGRPFHARGTCRRRSVRPRSTFEGGQPDVSSISKLIKFRSPRDRAVSLTVASARSALML